MANSAQRGAGAGRWFGNGCVYVMTYMKNETNYYKIGCTSKDPKKRLQEIQAAKKSRGIVLVGSVKANEMNGAETAAQQAVKAKGLVKDPERGGATDWFIGSLTPQQVLDVVRSAVYKHNAAHK